MSTFQAESELETAIHAGKLDTTVALLAAMAEDQRPGLRTRLLRMQDMVNEARWSLGSQTQAWGGKPSNEQMRALDAAILLCGTAADVASLWVNEDDLVSLGQRFRPRALEGLAPTLLAASPQRIVTVQRLISSGLAHRPDTPDYTLGLIALPQRLRDRAKLDELFASDPGLRPALLRVFDIEGTGDTSLASSDKYNHRKELSWGHLLLSLAQDGITDRACLLDKTLSALENDWPQFRSGWFSRFHAELAPDVTMLRAHLPRYLALCASRIAPTVTLALEALAVLDRDQPLDAEALIQALGPVCSSAVKAQVEAGLKLLTSAVKREPSLASTAADEAALALAHDSAVLQKKVLGCLATWGVDDALRERLADFIPCVAATNKPALLALIGARQASGTATSAPASHSTTKVDDDVLAPARQLQPLTDPQDLAMAIATVFEHPTNTDDFERCVGALVQACPLSEQDKAHLRPVLKRAGKVRHALAHELARLLTFAMTGVGHTGRPSVNQSGFPSPVEALLIERMDEAIAQAAGGHRLLPLSTPTHARGFIDPGTFIDRVAAHQIASWASTQTEQERALLRLAPRPAEDLRARAKRLADSAFTRALRYALGDEIEPGPETVLFAAAARIRHPGRDDEAMVKRHGDLGPDTSRAARYRLDFTSQSWTIAGQVYHSHDLALQIENASPPGGDFLSAKRHLPLGQEKPSYHWWSFAGIDAGAIAYSATVLPSCMEAFFADGARALGNNLDWSEAQWQNSSYLHPLLDPTVPMGPMATLTLALALLGKEAGQQAIAIDALVSSQAQQRLDVALLGATLKDLVRMPLVKTARLNKSLQAALRADTAMAISVFDLLCLLVTVQPEDPPKDMALLLELLLELRLTLDKPLPQSMHQALALLKITGRGKALRKALLSLGNVTR